MTIYRSALISRRDGVTKEQFRDHWIQVHGMLSSKMPGVGTYRQNHIAERYYENLEPPLQEIDGISQLSFESIAAMEVSDASTEYAAVKADIPNFQGAITILVLSAEEIVALPPDGPVPQAKLLWLSNRRGQLGGPELRKQWLAESSPRARDVPGLLRFVQNFVVDRGHPVQGAGVPTGNAGTVETVSEMWFESVDALNRAFASDQGRRFVYEDEYLRAMAVYRIDEVHIIR